MLDELDQSFAQQTTSEDRLRRFVADASHELRTPVTTIRGYAELYRIGGLPRAGASTRPCAAPSRRPYGWPGWSTTC